MGDFFYLSDLTCALSQMISSAEGEKYLSHKTDIMDKDGNVVKTVVSFVKEDSIDKVDDMIGYKYSLDPESVKEANSDYVYLNDRHVLGRMYDPHFEYVNNFMNTATQSKMLHGFEKTDDFAQMAIVHGVSIYKKNNPKTRRGRIKSIFNKK